VLGGNGDAIVDSASADGHPDMAAAVLNITGDARDEIVLWDEHSVWIYTQDRPFKGDKIYAPIRITTSRTTEP
jgi:rhamnogalacturonan endolyase